MAEANSGRGFDRNYKRGAVMGLTVAEAFILLSFCLLLLFTWWQIDTEKRSLMAADVIANLTPAQKAEVIAGLTDGTFQLASDLRHSGLDLTDPTLSQGLADYARALDDASFREMVALARSLDPQTREEIRAGLEDGSFALAAALRQAGADMGDRGLASAFETYARKIKEEDFRSLLAIAEGMDAATRAQIVKGLADGSFALAEALKAAGIDPKDPKIAQDLKEFSRFMREEDFRRLMEAAMPLDPQTRLSLADTVEVTDEAALRAALETFKSGDDTAERIAAKLASSAERQTEMVDLLNQRLGDSIRAAGGSIDAEGTISLPQSVLFDVGRDRIRNPDFLRSFCGQWIAALRQSGVPLSDLKIEGHASSEGRSSEGEERAYLYNLDLSQRRAKNALNFCLEGLPDTAARAWASERLAAIGYSSARLIFNPDGSENREASRRVMFSVNVNQEGLIEDIAQDVAEGAPTMAATGPARVIDGDTIEIAGTRFRLAGADAPERGQPCRNAQGQSFDCGEVARRGLEAAIAGQEVSCKASALDAQNLPLAECAVGGLDLGKAMILEGLAMPFEASSPAYLAEGKAAKDAKSGLWNTEFDMPWDYAKAH